MSIWNKKEIKREVKKLDKNIEVDILIIGAGITGMTTAYFLKDKNICVVDANRVGHGVTLNTTAKINYFQERIYTKIKNIRNEDIAKKYLKSQISAIKDQGIEELKQNILQLFNLEKIETSDLTYLSDPRSIALLKKSNKYLEEAIKSIDNQEPIEIIEINIKDAWETLGEIIGETYKEELLDELFSRFCLGK